MSCCRQPSQATYPCAAASRLRMTVPLPSTGWRARVFLAIRRILLASAFVVSALAIVDQASPLSADELQRLTEDGKRKLTPVFVSKGSEIVFAVHESPNLVAIKRLRWADKDKAEERVHPSISAHQFDPAFSPDGRFHAFAMSATSPQLVLVIQDLKEHKEATF